MSSHLFNIREIGRPDAPPLLLEFYGGDVLSVPSSMLLVSAFCESLHPTEGTVLGAIYAKYRVEFSGNLPVAASVVEDNVYDLGCPLGSDFAMLWAILMTSVHGPTSQAEWAVAFNRMRALRSGINAKGLTSISMPLIGTGPQGLSYSQAALNVVGVIQDWARHCPKLSAVRVVAYSLESAATLNRTIDAFFGDPLPEPSDAVTRLFEASVDELRDRRMAYTGEIRERLDALYDVATVRPVSVPSIGLAGRLLAETCAAGLFLHWETQSPKGRSLHELISSIQGRFVGKSSEHPAYVLSYARLLQTCGNALAHGDNLGLADASAVLLAGMRFAEFANLILPMEDQ